MQIKPAIVEHSEEQRVEANLRLVNDGYLYLPISYLQEIGLSTIIKSNQSFSIMNVLVSVIAIIELLDTNHLVIKLESQDQLSKIRFSEILHEFIYPDLKIPLAA